MVSFDGFNDFRRKISAVAQHFDRIPDVGAQLLAFHLAQRRRFAEEVGREADLADVLHQPGLAEHLDIPPPQAEEAAEHH